MLCLVVFMQKILLGLEPAPPLNKGYDSGEIMVDWSNKALLEVRKEHGLAKPVLSGIGKIIQYLESLSVAEIEQNKAHFDHLQKLKNCEFQALYWYGVHNLEHKAWNSSQIEKHLDQLRARNATPEFELIFLKALEWWPDFYKKQREVLELYEAYPNKLSLAPPIPPEIEQVQNLSINSLLDLTVMIDIALKYYWKPDTVSFESLLFKIASEFEAKKAYHYAREALELMDPKKRSSKLKQAIVEFKKKAESSQSSKSTKSLY